MLNRPAPYPREASVKQRERLNPWLSFGGDTGSFAQTKLLFTLNPKCFHLDFGVPTPPINHEDIR